MLRFSWKLVPLGLVTLAGLFVLLILGLGWFIAPGDRLEKADAIVVVSGGDTVKRTEAGIRLWEDGWAPRVVMAGAAADGGTSNAAVMRRQAIAAGVPAEDILVEERSTTTAENAALLKPVLEGAGVKRMIVVTSPYHARRVKVNFEKAFGRDYEVLIRPAFDTKWAKSSWWQSPDTIALTIDEFGKTLYTVLK